jgi:hypothetical protein
MQPSELQATRGLTERVFLQFEAPDYIPEGIAEFMKYIEPESIEQRQHNGYYFSLVCRVDGEIAGIIEMRDFKHMCLLFVDSDF